MTMTVQLAECVTLFQKRRNAHLGKELAIHFEWVASKCARSEGQHC